MRALKGVQLKVRPGTVHTLMGENGAGKSTLMKCLIGIHPPTSGKIIFKGQEVHYKTTLEAMNSGTLMGENGAGKSTLMKCLIGIHPPTSGKIIFKGQEVHYKTTLEAMNSGISMIHQELSPVPERSVCDNVWLGREPRKGLIVDHKKMREDCIALFKRLNLDLDPGAL